MNSASASSVADAVDLRLHANSGHRSVEPLPRAWPVAVLGVPFDHVTIDQTIARIDSMIASRQPHYIVTANVDFLVQAHRDVELRRILLEADLVLCDGTPVLWASRSLGNALPERVAGSDLAPSPIRSAAEKGHRLFFLGAAPGVATEAEHRLKREFPQLNVVGTYAPPFAQLLDMNHEEIVRRVRAAKPDILLVSFGCPKQEKWIAMHHRTLGVPVAIGVGATLDFLAGRVKRAPGWMRHTGTEWIFRLAQEPRRLFRRYAGDLCYFLPTLARQWWRLAPNRRAGAPPREIPRFASEWRSIDSGTRLTRRTLEEQAEFWGSVCASQDHCLIDVSRVQAIDGTGIAFLVHCRKQLRARGRNFVLLAPSAAVRRVLVALRLTDHFSIATDAVHAVGPGEAPVAPAVCEGTTRSLAWCGEIVAANRGNVWETTTHHLRVFVAGQTTLVIVDLARLRFIDSSGAALMLRLKKWARARHVEVLFAHAQPNVRNVLRLTRLDQLLLEGSQ